ncbi:MAG: hypothetical protein JW769_03750 [Parachlamydiales bacterium]|nr:hypothetical protein [Parachlamydiales bacterium]
MTDGIIKAEWEPLRKVVMHRPGVEMFFGLLDPTGSLYERAFSRQGAVREHAILESVFREEFGVEVIQLKHAILHAADHNSVIRDRLIDMAGQAIDHAGTKEKVKHLKSEFVRNAKYLDSEHFFDILLMNPGIDFEMDAVLQNLRMNISNRHALCNLYFMRDQQFVTDRGIVICNLAKSPRKREPQITKFLWKEVLQLPIALEITDPGTIEGGEFLPMGKFALVGIGSRTNREAIDQLLTVEFDYEEIGIVHQPLHPLISADEPDPMVNMHLDTYFNVAGSNVVVGCDLLLKNARVEIYYNEGNGQYRKADKDEILYDYIIKKGFSVVNITTLEQLSYASNFLCIRDGTIVAIEVERIVTAVLTNLEVKAREDAKRYGKLYAQAKKDFEVLKNEGQFFPHKKELYQAGVDAYPVILKNLTGGYGGAHCMTCALTRG